MQPGHATVVAAMHAGKNGLERARAESPMRLLLPKAAGATAAWVCVTSLGGGLVRGDALALDVEVKPGATLLLTTQASTKAFRGATRQTWKARVDGTLVAWPDPVSCFADATYESDIDVALGPQGSLILVDTFTSGRPAYGERWAFQRFTSRIRVTRQDRPVVLDTIDLSARHGPIAARFHDVDAFATVLALGPRAAPIIEAMAAPSPPGSVLYAPSPTAAGMMARVAGRHSEDVLQELRRRLRNVGEICGVDPYASRH